MNSLFYSEGAFTFYLLVKLTAGPSGDVFLWILPFFICILLIDDQTVYEHSLFIIDYFSTELLNIFYLLYFYLLFYLLLN